MPRSRVALLVALGAVWAWIGIRWLWPGDVPVPVREAAPARKGTARDVGVASFPVVDLSVLEAPVAAPGAGTRDLFSYFVPPPPKPPPETPEQIAARARAAEESARRAREQQEAARVAAQNAPPPPPPPPPPIKFKFQGYMEKEGVKYAILKDEDGLLHVGREGDTVAFRFKVIKIGHESIDMGYVDNAAHQQIELSGS